MTQTERESLQDILVEYVENPRKLGPCILKIEDLFRHVYSRWNGFRNEHRDISKADEILERIAAKYSVDPERIRGNRRSRYLVRAREEIAWLMYKEGFSYAEIARHLNRHASTIIYTLDKAKKKPPTVE